jgi:hypothetical protein
MTSAAEKLTSADSRDLADAIAFALRFEGRQRVHDAEKRARVRQTAHWIADARRLLLP